MALIETVDLCQRRGGRDILKEINLKVEPGEVFAIIGPTGAGKTTLLRLIDLLETPASGSIYFDGVDIVNSRRQKLEVRRRMAFVLQKPVVFNANVYDNIACGLKWRGKKAGNIQARVDSILETIGLAPYRNRNARTLSGGEAQRVAIARAIAVEPEVLLLDEPTANLDPTSTSKVEELIEKIYREYKTTIIMATHDFSQGQRLASRIGVLINGQLVQIGDAREVFNLPRTREVAQFVGVGNIIEGAIVSSDSGIAAVDVGGGVIIEAVSDYKIGERISVCIRPEDITLSLTKSASSARNSLRGRITKVVSAGSLARVELDCGFPLAALVTKRSAEELNLAGGNEVYVSFKATGAHLIKR